MENRSYVLKFIGSAFHYIVKRPLRKFIIFALINIQTFILGLIISVNIVCILISINVP